MIFFDIFHSTRLICAHRGFRSHWPENTLSAFKASIGRCHFIELDVQMSKDAIPMVFHDPTLSRTSDARTKQHQLGLCSLDVKSWTVSQLKTLDVGSWFIESDPFSVRVNQKLPLKRSTTELSQTIMTLEELLLHPVLSTTPVNIEIKDHTGSAEDKTVVPAVIDTIEKTQSTDRVLISSFNHKYLTISKKLCPKITTAALKRDFHPPDLINYLTSLDVAAYHTREDITDTALISRLRSAGFFVSVFTVNNRQRQKELFDQGVTAIITDFPELVETHPGRNVLPIL